MEKYIQYLLEKTQSTYGIKVKNPHTMERGKVYMTYTGTGENVHMKYLGYNRGKQEHMFDVIDGVMRGKFNIKHADVPKKVRELDKFYYKH